MASQIFKLLIADSMSSMQIRHKMTRGRPPGIARNLKQRIAEMEYKDPNLYYKVDIGFKVDLMTRSNLTKIWMKELQAQRKDPNLEKQARTDQLVVDLDKVKQDWLITNGSSDIKRIAEHFGIYDSLYEDGYFYPVVPLTIDYDIGNEELLARVYTGNCIKSNNAQKAPTVTYQSDPNTLWTLLLTTPDGNFSDPEYEYCHWFIGNIPGNDISQGEQIIDYLRPIPAKEYKKEQPCLTLVERNWKTYDFMRKHQDYITPAGLAFFQSDYDCSLKDFYHNVLQMEEPIFEYDFPKPYIKPQTWFPKKEPFNLYMDKYRDPKQINKEFLLKKLKKEHPFKFPDPPLKYPNAHPIKGYVPSWLKTEIKKERLGMGRINDYK